MSQTFVLLRHEYASMVNAETGESLISLFPNGIIIEIDDDGKISRITHAMSTPEPDMDRMGAQYMRPCTGCDAMLLWAKNVRTGKPAPLIKAIEDEKPNISAWYDEEKKHWIYGVGHPASGVYEWPGGPTLPLEFVSHFSNCPKSKDFKPRQWKDAQTRG
jgi:hypothetical protein